MREYANYFMLHRGSFINRNNPILSQSAYNVILQTGFFIWMATKLICQSFIAIQVGYIWLDIIRVAALALVVLAYVLYGRWRAMEYLGIAVLLLLLYIKSNVNADSMLDLIIICYCARYTNYESMAKAALVASVGVLISVALLTLLHILPNYTVDYHGRQREYIGFKYALIPSMIMFNITCIVCYLKKNSLTFSTAFILVVINTLIYEKTDSRLSYILSIILILVCISLRNKNSVSLRRLLNLIGPYSTIICFIISWFLVFCYILLLKNKIVATGSIGIRLRLSSEAISNYGVPVAGQQIKFIGEGLDANGLPDITSYHNYVDMLYILLPIQYGWLFTIVYVVGWTLMAYNAKKKGDFYLLAVTVSISLHNILDNMSILLYYNTFTILMVIEISNIIRNKLHKQINYCL